MAYAIDPFPDSGPSGDVDLAVAPKSLHACGPQTVSAIVRAAGAGTHGVVLRAEGLPPPVEAVFDPPRVPPGEPAALRLTVPARTRPGTYPVTVLASAPDGRTAHVRLSLTVL